MPLETPIWQVAEVELLSAVARSEPTQACELRATFTGPSGRVRRVLGFWDGGSTWRVRFAPDEEGTWTGVTTCTDTADVGLHDVPLEIHVAGPRGATPFDRHGPVRVAGSGRHFVHADGEPFLWLADTCWNGPLRSDDEEWRHYLRERTRQGFSAVQWVATQYLASVEGDRDGRLPYSGRERIAIDPAFFQRLDGKMRAIRDAGLLGVPVLLWAAEWREEAAINATNPGYDLPEDQAILLARHMVARWDAYPVAWFLGGDAPYTGDRAPRWRRIGRAVFEDIDHAPVTLHPNGMSWFGPDFDDEAWLDYIGYQSGHGDDESTVDWLVAGPPATGWQELRPRPVINLEPPYEGHLGYQSGLPFDATDVRRRLAWSLLVAPTAGVTYGGHGVWGWDDGTTTPQNHPRTGVPLPWREALLMEGAEQMVHLRAFLDGIEWWRLRPDPDLVVEPGGGSRFVAAASTPEGDLAVVYVPEEREVRLRPGAVPKGTVGTWADPVSGATMAADVSHPVVRTPGAGDWWLTLERGA
jgi:hypothetical protein